MLGLHEENLYDENEAWTHQDRFRGPSSPGTLVPGERASVLVVSGTPDPEEAMREAMGRIGAFERDCPIVLDSTATSLYAVAAAEQLQEGLRPPADEGPAEFLDFIAAEQQWGPRGDCPATPPDSNGASAWAWAYYRAVRGAHPQALCTIWDVYPLSAAAD